MATSIVALCNLALAHVGAGVTVSSIDPPDGSVEAGYCAQFYPPARLELLEAHAWTFAKTRVALAAVDNPSTVWAYAYALPSGMIDPLRVLQTTVLESYGFFPFGGLVRADEIGLFTERGSSDFEVEGDVLLTHEPDAVLLYKQDVVDSSAWSPGFVMALSLLLGSYLAGPLVRGSEGRALAMDLRKLANSKALEAMANDANSSSERQDFMPAHMRARA